MRNNIFISAIILIMVFFTGCSEENPVSDNSSSLPETIQFPEVPEIPEQPDLREMHIKKVKSIDYTLATTKYQDVDFNYENGILKEVVIDNSMIGQIRRIVFTYDGEKPIKTETYSPSRLLGTSIWNYEGDLLKSKLNVQDIEQRKTEYFYNDSEQVILEKNSTKRNDQDFVLSDESSLTYSGTNVAEIVATSYYFGFPPLIIKQAFTYDAKINPFKFQNKYLREFSEFSLGTGENNTTSIRYQYLPENVIGNQRIEILYDGDYPVEVKKFTGLGRLQLHITYEYQ